MNTNVVWDALQINSFIASDPKIAEVYMSISGTIVFNEKGAIEISKKIHYEKMET